MSYACHILIVNIVSSEFQLMSNPFHLPKPFMQSHTIKMRMAVHLRSPFGTRYLGPPTLYRSFNRKLVFFAEKEERKGQLTQTHREMSSRDI